jgi:pyruvate dehydrogenase E2 component (dihydrolipoamide acetyltransferase)
MPIEIKMPALSPTMTAGNLAKWLKAEGDRVVSGDVLAEIETDKATMEVEAVDEGTLGRIVIPNGTEGVAVGTVIALLLAEGESPSALTALPKPAPVAPPSSSPVAPTIVPPVAPAVAPPPPSSGRLFASPLARRIAGNAGLDLAQVTGSGPHGRIVKADVEAALANGIPAVPKPVAAPPPAQLAPLPTQAPALSVALGRDRVVALAGNLPHQFIPHTGMRRTIARRLTEAKQTIPHFYLTIECELDRLLAARTELNNRSTDYKLSVNDFIIAASARALRKVPEANASWSDDGLLLWGSVDVAVAVAIDGGLITPIVKRADTKGLAAISAEMKDLGARAKTGKLKLDEFQGGTFSISNLGMFAIKEFSAVINPPHGAILAVGAGEQRPIVRQGALGIATMMSVTLSVDHRVIDGVIGARFLQAFKGLIEEPLSMLL